MEKNLEMINKILKNYILKNKERVNKDNILNFFNILGLNIIIKEHINEFEFGIEFEQILECFLNETPIIEYRVDGQIIIRNDNCRSYLSEENRLVKPINIKISISRGNLSIKTSYNSNLYDDGSMTKKAKNYDICVLSTGHIKCMSSKYVLNEKRSYKKREFNGSGYLTISEFNPDLTRIYRHDIFFSNKPVIKEFENTNVQKELENVIENDINIRIIEAKDLSKGIVDWKKSNYANSELIIYSDLDKRQTAVYKNKDDEEIILTKRLTKRKID